MPALLVALIFRTLDALRAFDLPKVLTNGANGTTTLSLIAYQDVPGEPTVRRGIGVVDPHVHHRDGGLVRLHPPRRRQHPRHDGGVTWKLHPSPRRDASAQEEEVQAAARRRPKTPWWLWVAVAAIVLFCLFPFYWLVNISLKTGADLSTADLVPAEPDAGQLQVDLRELRLHDGAGQQRDRGAGDDVPRDRRRLVLRVRARAAEDAGQVRSCWPSCSRSRRSRRSRSRRRCSGCGRTSASTTR